MRAGGSTKKDRQPNVLGGGAMDTDVYTHVLTIPHPRKHTGNMGPLIRSLRHMCGPQGGRLFLQVRFRFLVQAHRIQLSPTPSHPPPQIKTQASVFAGCDYLASISGVGPMSAWEMAVKCRCASSYHTSHRSLFSITSSLILHHTSQHNTTQHNNKHRTVPSHKRLERMVRNLPLKKRREAPGDYIQRAYHAGGARNRAAGFVCLFAFRHGMGSFIPILLHRLLLQSCSLPTTGSMIRRRARA